MRTEKKEIFKKIKEDNVKLILLQFTDMLGTVKSVTIPIEELESAIDFGSWFDGSSVEGFARIWESDMFLRPDLSTYNVIPWLKTEGGNVARFICDIYNPDGTVFEGDPRFILKKSLAEAEKMGYIYNVGPEIEFFLFKRDDGVKVLPHDKGGYFDFSLDLAFEIRKEIVHLAKEFGIIIEASHHECAQGQHEVDIKYSDALKVADNVITVKFIIKYIAQKNGLHAVFMPKPIFGIPGSGMHIHQSLFDIKNTKNLFYDPKDSYKLSELAYKFMAGQLRHVKEMSSILSPLANSYKRLTPGYEAPVYICWGQINRSALIRVPRISKGSKKASRLEIRCPDPSCNPYLAFSVLLKSGLEGVKRKLKRTEPVEENVYEYDESELRQHNIDTLPDSLGDAVEELEKSELVKETLGEEAHKKYVRIKTKEWDDYRIQVHQWEIDRYLDIV